MKESLFSPDRRYKVVFSSYEVSMSHWIDQPFLLRVSDDCYLFDLGSEVWSAWTTHWLDESVVELYLRKYPGLIDCTVRLNLATNEATATSLLQSVAGTFPAVRAWVLSLS